MARRCCVKTVAAARRAFSRRRKTCGSEQAIGRRPVKRLKDRKDQSCDKERVVRDDERASAARGGRRARRKRREFRRRSRREQRIGARRRNILRDEDQWRRCLRRVIRRRKSRTMQDAAGVCIMPLGRRGIRAVRTARGLRAIRERHANSALRSAAENGGLQQENARERGDHAGARSNSFGSEVLKQSRISQQDNAGYVPGPRGSMRCVQYTPRQSAARTFCVTLPVWT